SGVSIRSDDERPFGPAFLPQAECLDSRHETAMSQFATQIARKVKCTMPCSTRHLPSLILSAVLCVLWIAQPAAAQSDNDLRRENQRLQSELQDTTRELEAARSRIEELQREVARLERALELARGSRPGDSSPTPPEQVTIDE